MSINIYGQASLQYTPVGKDIKQQPEDNTPQHVIPAANERSEKIEVQLSDQASLLSTLSQIIKAVPVINETRVNDVKLKIDNGYITDYLHLAERIIKTEQEIY